MLEIKDSKQVEENEHIRFRCMRCAACCRHVRGSVVIEGLDAYRLAQHLKMEVADFISQYADPFLLDEQLWYPIFSLRVKGNDDSCIFLKGSRCTVQDAKPRTCRLYPFWVEPNEPDLFLPYLLRTPASSKRLACSGKGLDGRKFRSGRAESPAGRLSGDAHSGSLAAQNKSVWGG